MWHASTTRPIPSPAMPHVPVLARFFSRPQLLTRISLLSVGRDILS
jgi:hypothetical protein